MMGSKSTRWTLRRALLYGVLGGCEDERAKLHVVPFFPRWRKHSLPDSLIPRQEGLAGWSENWSRATQKSFAFGEAAVMQGEFHAARTCKLRFMG
jgi:hypothetical protein